MRLGLTLIVIFAAAIFATSCSRDTEKDAIEVQKTGADPGQQAVNGSPLRNQKLVLDGSTAGCHYFKSEDPAKLDIFQSNGGAGGWMNLMGDDQKISEVANEENGRRSKAQYRGYGFDVAIDVVSEDACTGCTYVILKGTMTIQKNRRSNTYKIEGTCGS